MTSGRWGRSRSFTRPRVACALEGVHAPDGAVRRRVRRVRRRCHDPPWRDARTPSPSAPTGDERVTGRSIGRPKGRGTVAARRTVYLDDARGRSIRTRIREGIDHVTGQPTEREGPRRFSQAVTGVSWRWTRRLMEPRRHIGRGAGGMWRVRDATRWLVPAVRAMRADNAGAGYFVIRTETGSLPGKLSSNASSSRACMRSGWFSGR